MKLTEKFLKDLLEKGLIMEKIIYQGTPSSGAVYLPKALVGRAVRLIVIPLDADEMDITSLKNKKQKVSVDAYEYDKLKNEIKELREKIESPKESMKSVGSSEITQSEPPQIDVPKKIAHPDEGRFNIDLSPRKEDG